MRFKLFLATLPLLSLSSQIPFESHPSPSPSFSKTLTDILSDDPEYLSLLELIIHARLVPTLNALGNATLFAPTNDAIEKHRSTNPLWNSILGNSSFLINDNVRNELRQQLFYHLVNSTITLPKESEPLTVLETLHYPQAPLEPPTHDPPPNPPWMPIPGGTLGDKPQRLRIVTQKDTWVGVDSFGKGGTKVIKDRTEASNGVVFGIADVLEPPPNLATVIAHNSDVSYFHNVLTDEIIRTLNSTPTLTVFLPVNKAWESLDKYERLYLESRYATDDLKKILNMHAVANKQVVWSEDFEQTKELTTIDGTTLEVVVTPEKTTVSTATLVQADIYASNGVLHVVDTLLTPPEALKMTPEKYLLTLDCSKFVALIHETDLTYLINDTEAKYTILAPSDDVISFFSNDGLPERGSEEMKRMLQYHFLPGRLTPKKLKAGMLVETTLEEKGLCYQKQVLNVEASDGDSNSWKSLKFGGASVVREPVEVNNTLIYFISKPITPPSDVLDTTLPMLDHSSFVAAILSTSISDKLRDMPHTTLLLPDNNAFKRLGLLVSKHLLAATNKVDLENVLLHHTLATVQYTNALQSGTKHSFATLEESDLTVERKENGTIFVSASGGWAGMKSEIRPRNILTRTGVIHELSDILIPRSMELNIGKLVKAADGTTMASLLVKAGFGWVLNGASPPEDSPWADEGLDGAGWTLLCPTDDAFDGYNLTELVSDKERLVMLVSQHLIPAPSKKGKKKDGEASLDIEDPLNNNRPLLLEESATYSTLRSPSSAYGDIVFKKDTEANGGFIVGIKNARGTDGKSDWANVEAWGRATNGRGTGGVIQIDQLLVPYQPPWWLEFGAPTVVGVIGVFLIGAFFYVVRLVWRRDTTEATYEPVGGFTRDDDEES